MTLLQAAFIISVLGIIWSIYRLHLNPAVNFNMLDLLIENGKVSKVSCLVMGAFFVGSWIMVDSQARGKMTEGLFGLYVGAFVAPLIARLLKNDTEPAPTVVTTATAEVVTTTKGRKR